MRNGDNFFILQTFPQITVKHRHINIFTPLVIRVSLFLHPTSVSVWISTKFPHLPPLETKSRPVSVENVCQLSSIFAFHFIGRVANRHLILPLFNFTLSLRSILSRYVYCGSRKRAKKIRFPRKAPFHTSLNVKITINRDAEKLNNFLQRKRFFYIYFR